MKKKSLLTAVVSIALIAVLAVGATLAYMTSNSNPVTNTFTFGSINVTLDEKTPNKTANETITKNTGNNGWDYTNVVPNQDLDKEPFVKVTSTVDAYVFVKISGFDVNLSAKAITDGWTAMADVDAYGNGTYYKTVTGSPDEQDLGTLFTTVTIGNVVDTATTTLKDVKLQVAAIQKTGFTDAAQALLSAKFQG